MSNTFEHKDDTGSLFKNEKTSENAPDYKGKAKVNGELKDMAAWINKSKDGTKTYLSITFQEPYNVAGAETKVNKVAQSDSDLPF